jgi:hypothetical protein
VHDFRKCDIRVLHVIEPEEGEAVQDNEDKKDCKPDPTEKPIEIGSPDSIKTDSPSNQMMTGFPPTPDEFVYVEEDCVKYVHASGPLDIGCDFEAVNELVLSNLTRSSLQYTDYFDLIHDFSIFFDKWLTVDTVQFYQCWVSRSIGSYPNNIFLFRMDYYQADVEDIFEDYWNGIQPSFKKNSVMRMWRYVISIVHSERHCTFCCPLMCNLIAVLRLSRPACYSLLGVNNSCVHSCAAQIILIVIKTSFLPLEVKRLISSCGSPCQL